MWLNSNPRCLPIIFACEHVCRGGNFETTKLAHPSVLRPFGVHLLTFTLPPQCIDALFGNLRCLTHHNTHETYLIYPMIAISENT